MGHYLVVAIQHSSGHLGAGMLIAPSTKAAYARDQTGFRRAVPLAHRTAMAAAAVLLICFAVRSGRTWKFWGNLSHNSPGTWLCMAGDLRSGLFYRPLYSGVGYGGTRYAHCWLGGNRGFFEDGNRAGRQRVSGGCSRRWLRCRAVLAIISPCGRRRRSRWRWHFLPAAMCADDCAGHQGRSAAGGSCLWGLTAVVRADRRDNFPRLCGGRYLLRLRAGREDYTSSGWCRRFYG